MPFDWSSINSKMAASLYACCQRLTVVCNRRCSVKSAASVLSQCSRKYARGIKRTPYAVRTPEEDLEKLKKKGTRVKDPRQNPWVTFVPGDPTQAQFTKEANQQQRRPGSHETKMSPKHPQLKTKQKPVPQIKSSSRDVTQTGLQYEKLEEGDKRFGRVLMAAKSRKEREKRGIILLEGRRLIMDSLQAGVQLKYLYFSDAELVSSLPVHLLGDAQLYKVQYRHLKMWADTHTPAGMLGVFAKPSLGEAMLPQQGSLPLMLICDNIRDPGNMGTVIRTAAAAGCNKILTTKGCVDVWDPKVLRAAMGGHFFTNIVHSLPWEQIVNYVSPSTYLCIADARRSNRVEKSFDIAHPKAIELLSSAEPDAEALSSNEENEETRTLEDSEIEVQEDELSDGEPSDLEEDAKNEWSNTNSEEYKRVPLSVIEYSDMDLSMAEEVAVIIGGETEGVSPQAKKFAFERYGQFVTIPMMQAVDSLNTATAAAVVLYEARRQLKLRMKRDRRKQGISGASG